MEFFQVSFLNIIREFTTMESANKWTPSNYVKYYYIYTTESNRGTI